jgi:hypothetical protein
MNERSRGVTRAIAVIVSLIAACSPEQPSLSTAPDLRVALGKSVTDMSVSGAIPDSATQDTTLDVVINGSGFVAGTSANWALAGVQDPAQVRTNSTRYVNSRQLVANITISTSATIAKWDIVVTAVGKKGGIGSEAFTIKVRGNTDTGTKANLVWEDMVNVAAPGQTPVWEPALLTGDYRSRNGSAITTGKSGEYQGEFCGSESYMQNQQMSGSEAALNFEPDHGYVPLTMDIPCGGKRYYQFYFSGRGAAPLRAGPQHYALKLGTLSVGQSILEEVHFGIQQANCSALHFNDIYAPASNARVTRLTDSLTSSGMARRWLVQSQGTHRAMCAMFSNKGPVPTGVTYYLPFAYTITEALYPFPHFP